MLFLMSKIQQKEILHLIIFLIENIEQINLIQYHQEIYLKLLQNLEL